MLTNILITTNMIILNLYGQNMVMICEPYLAPDLQMPAGFFVLFLSPVNRRVVAITLKSLGGVLLLGGMHLFFSTETLLTKSVWPSMV